LMLLAHLNLSFMTFSQCGMRSRCKQKKGCNLKNGRNF
jgi:hypothetical protein